MCSSDLGGVSVHLTVGVAAYTRNDVVREAVARAADIAELRASLPVGFDPGDPAAVAPVVEETLAALIEALSDPPARSAVADAVAERLRQRQRSDSPPAPVRPLATIVAADALAAGTVVVARRELRADVTVEVETVTVRLPGKTVALPIAARAAVERLLDGRPAAVGELPLDERSAVVVARRLLREGVLVLAAEARGGRPSSESAEDIDFADPSGVSSDGERSATLAFGTATAT